MDANDILCYYQDFIKGDELKRRKKLYDFYYGNDDIGKVTYQSKRIDNRINVNLANMISNNSVFYFLGREIKTETDIKEVEDLIYNNDDSFQNKSVGLDASVTGIAYELCGVREKQGKKQLFYTRLDPLTTFAIKDDTIFKETQAVITFTTVSEKCNNISKEWIEGTCYTVDELIDFKIDNNQITILDTLPNVFKGKLPVIEYPNNRDRTGDFEFVTPLLTQYSKLFSLATDDYEGFANTLLAFINAELGEDEGAKLVRSRIIELVSKNGEVPDAKYLSKNLDSTIIKQLRDMMREEIFAICNVPDLTDNNFAGQQSGVALNYKLQGFENLRQNKQQFFEKALYNRFEVFAQYVGGGYTITPDNLKFTFFSNLPNNIELDLKIMQLHNGGVLSLETTVENLSFVVDTKLELERLEAERARNTPTLDDFRPNLAV